MARFDVYVQRSGAVVLDCQSDLLSTLNTRLVVPLIPLAAAPAPARRLNPIFEIRGERLAMVTQFAAAIPARELGERLLSLIGEDVAITNALDMLLFGF